MRKLSDNIGVFVELEDQVVVLSNLESHNVELRVGAHIFLSGAPARTGPVNFHLALGAAAVTVQVVPVVALHQAEVKAVAAFLYALSG